MKQLQRDNQDGVNHLEVQVMQLQRDKKSLEAELNDHREQLRDQGAANGKTRETLRSSDDNTRNLEAELLSKDRQISRLESDSQQLRAEFEVKLHSTEEARRNAEDAAQ